MASVAFIIYRLSIITISDHQQDKSYTAGELNPLLLMAGTASAAFEIQLCWVKVHRTLHKAQFLVI